MQDNPTLAAALAYAEAGWYIFPCIAGGKTPACANGVHDATRDPAIINQWFTENPRYNIAAAPDRSGHFVVDVDPPLGAETLASLEMEHGLLPSTLTFQTPRGGLHHWFTGSCPSSVGTERNGLGPKLDTRGVGGYALLPPSIVQGKGYERLVDAPVAEGPRWIAEVLARSREHHASAGVDLDQPANVARVRDLLDRYVRDGDVAVQGSGGDDRTYRLACEVLNLGLSAEKATDLIAEHWNPFCQPEWTRDELTAKVANAASYAQNDAGAWAVPPASELFAEFVRNLPQTSDKVSRFRPLALTETDAFKEPTWLIPGLIPEGGTVQITGPQKSFKTFLALDMACGIAAGAETFGHTPQPRSVVYVAGENASAIVLNHVPAWRLASLHDAPMPFYIVPNMVRAAEPGEVAELITEIRKQDIAPGVVVIDTATRALRGLDENSSKDMGMFSAACEQIQRELNCTVIVIRHTGKDAARGGRGSNVIEGDFDTILTVDRHEKSMFVALTVKEQRNAAEREEPYLFEGQVVGPSLAFHTVTPDAYRRGTAADDPYSRDRIGAALRVVGAIGEGRGVVTAVLAAQLVEPLPSDSAEDRQRAVRRVEKSLKILARGRLEAYAVGEGTALKWSLPAAEAPGDC